MKKKRKYIYLEKCLIIRILQIYIFSFYDFLFFISLSDAKNDNGSGSRSTHDDRFTTNNMAAKHLLIFFIVFI